MSSKGSFRANTAKTPSVRRNLFHHHLSRRPTTTSTSNSCPTTQEPARDETSEIVARDNKGNYQFRVPALPPLEDDHVPDEEMGHERDKLEARMLAELYKERSLQPNDSTEWATLAHQSLKRRVASLADDNWMFEAERPMHDG